MRLAWSGWAALWLALAGCGEQARTQKQCGFGDEHLVVRAAGGFDDVELLAEGDHALAIWSATDGTWLQEIDAAGAPLGRAERVAARCDGGLALARDEQARWFACLQGEDLDSGKAGQALVLMLGAAREVRWRQVFGPVGRGRGVAIAPHPEGGAVVAWLDGDAGVQRVHAGPGRDELPRLLSRRGTSAGPPSLYRDGSRVFTTWAETVQDPKTKGTVGEVLVDDGSGPADAVVSVLYHDALPRLTRHADKLVLSYRDEKPAGWRVALFGQQLDAELHRFGPPVRFGRSDSDSGASVFPCGSWLFGVAAHTYSRTEELVGINVFDAELERVVGERQFYTAGGRYAHGVGACVRGTPIALSAERPRTATSPAAMKSFSLRCEM